jgi:hypothetical protein
LKILSHVSCDDKALIVIRLDKPTGADLIKKAILIDGAHWIPTHLLVYNDRVELKVECFMCGQKKVKRFSFADLLVMNWALSQINLNGKEGK